MGMVEVSRPYMSASLVELTAMVQDESSSEDVRATVMDELRHRGSKGARRLLAQLEQGPTGSIPRPSAEGRGRDVREVAPTATGLPSDERLAILRETYTEGAEVLARWGLTTAVPSPLFDVVVEWWREVVGERPDRFGRTRSRLEEDVARVKSLGAIAEGVGARGEQ